LMDAVVGEARQVIRYFVNVDFGFFGACEAGQTKNGCDDAMQFALE